MRKFLKFVLILSLISALGLVTAYPVYKHLIFDRVRIFLSEKLSEYTDLSIDIGSLKISPSLTLDLSRVRIQKNTAAFPSPVNINNMRISFELLAFLKNRRLETTIRLEGIEKDGILADAMIRTYSAEAPDHKTVLSPSLLTDIYVIDARLSSRDFRLKNISGKIKVENLKFLSSVMSFSYKEKMYMVKLWSLADTVDKFRVSLLSDTVDLNSLITYVNDQNLLVEYLTGSFYCFDLALEGYVKNFSNENMDLAFDGDIRIDLSSLKDLPGDTGASLGKLDLSGIIDSSIKFKSSDPFFREYDLQTKSSSGIIKIGKVKLTKVTADAIIKDGRLNIPSVRSKFYGGNLYGDMKMDIMEANLPYILYLSVDDMYLDDLIEDISGAYSPVYGNAFVKLYVKGYALDDTTTEGTLEVEISDGDLGPMPIIAPLLGDIYSILHNTIIARENRVNISRAYGDFSIKDRKITTYDAIMTGNTIAIIGTGYMDFDGNLNFTIENKFTQTPIEESGNWQVSLRNSMIRFGKALGKAQLKGTITNPKWIFNYFPKK